MALPAVPGHRQGFILSESGILPPDGMAIFSLHDQNSTIYSSEASVPPHPLTWIRVEEQCARIQVYPLVHLNHDRLVFFVLDRGESVGIRLIECS